MDIEEYNIMFVLMCIYTFMCIESVVVLWCAFFVFVNFLIKRLTISLCRFTYYLYRKHLTKMHRTQQKPAACKTNSEAFTPAATCTQHRVHYKLR